MSANWIKILTSLPESPKILRISAALGRSRYECLGRCMALWAWADSHTETGLLRGLSAGDIDGKFDCVGFFDSLQSVGWADETPEGVVLPRWEEHNSQSAKRRATDASAKRQRRCTPHNQHEIQRTQGGHVADIPRTQPRRREDDHRTTSGHRADALRTREEKRRGREEPPHHAAHGSAADPRASAPAPQPPKAALKEALCLPSDAWPGEAPAMSITDSIDLRRRIVEAWNAGPSVRRAGTTDCRHLQSVLDQIARGEINEQAQRSPAEWLLSQVTAYVKSDEGRNYPTSLFQFFSRGKFGQPPDAWRNRPEPEHDPASSIVSRALDIAERTP